jgi:hypothetical protein
MYSEPLLMCGREPWLWHPVFNLSVMTVHTNQFTKFRLFPFVKNNSLRKRFFLIRPTCRDAFFLYWIFFDVRNRTGSSETAWNTRISEPPTNRIIANKNVYAVMCHNPRQIWKPKFNSNGPIPQDHNKVRWTDERINGNQPPQDHTLHDGTGVPGVSRADRSSPWVKGSWGLEGGAKMVIGMGC